jgi:putative tricarboxylic transport membrane protein
MHSDWYIYGGSKRRLGDRGTITDTRYCGIMATTFDGYPMALKGEGLNALRIGTFASFFGGIFSALALLLLAPLLAKVALGFGPWDYFGCSVLALSLVCVLFEGEMLKGFISVCIGLFTTAVGMSPIDGIAQRFSFGNVNLENGFNLIAIVIGIFALPEILNNVGKLKEVIHPVEIEKKRFYMLPLSQIKKYFGTFIRSSIIGSIIGIMPGLGGGPAGLIAYAQEKRLSKTPEEFGNGTGYGIAASESANNATTGGALIPALSLSIPGDTSTAIIIGAFTYMGILTGPLLGIRQPELFRMIIVCVFVANIFMFLLQAGTIRYHSKILQVPRHFLMPIVTAFCVTGLLCLNNNIFDVYYTIGFLVLGYILEKNRYPIPPLILGAVLGGIIETNLRRSISYYGSFMGSLSRMSVGTIMFAMAVIFPILTVIFSLINKRKKEAV